MLAHADPGIGGFSICKNSGGVVVLSASVTCSAAAVGARAGVDGRTSGSAAGGGGSTVVGI